MAANIELVVFDLAGTTVDDSIDGLPLVTVAMKDAFASHGIKVTPEQVNKYRGMDKKQAIKYLLNECQLHSSCDNENISERESGSKDLDTIFKDFKKALNEYLVNIDKEIPGATETFDWLHARGVQLAVGSGFPHDVVLTLVNKLKWKDLLQYVSSAEQEGHSRPHPCLIHSAMKHCSITDKSKVLKIGDTVMDIEEGKNAGCWTVAVLTGTQKECTLRLSNPDYIIDSIADLPDLLERLKC